MVTEAAGLQLPQMARLKLGNICIVVAETIRDRSGALGPRPARDGQRVPTERLMVLSHMDLQSLCENAGLSSTGSNATLVNRLKDQGKPAYHDLCLDSLVDMMTAEGLAFPPPRHDVLYSRDQLIDIVTHNLPGDPQIYTNSALQKDEEDADLCSSVQKYGHMVGATVEIPPFLPVPHLAATFVMHAPCRIV